LRCQQKDAEFLIQHSVLRDYQSGTVCVML
jgi:hypothetical protein